MAEASLEGSSFLDNHPDHQKYAQNEAVLDEVYEDQMASLGDDQMEDIIARGAALGDAIEQRKHETVDQSVPSTSQPTQPVVTSAPSRQQKGKTRKMLSRQPVGTSVPATITPASTVPNAPTDVDKTDSAVVDMRQEEKFRTPPQSSSWSEEFDMADDRLPYPSDDNKGGMFGTSDPVLSAASSHLADVEERIEGELKSVMRALEALRADMNQANTETLNRIRELERKLPHDASISVASSQVPSFRTSATTTSEPSPTSPRLSFNERLRLKREQKKV